MFMMPQYSGRLRLRGGMQHQPNIRRHGASLAGGTVATVVLNVATMGLNFLLTLTLSRSLGVSGYGAFAFAFAWVTALSSAAVLGLSPLVVRNVAAYQVERAWGLMRGVLRRANQVVLATSVVIVGAAGAAGWLLHAAEPQYLGPYLIGLLLIPLVALTSLRQAAMQSLGRIIVGRLPESVLAPVLVVTLSLALAVTMGDRFTASWAMAMYVVSFAVAFAVGAYLLRHTLPADARAATPSYETRVWARSAIPLFLATGVGALSAPMGTILVGLLGGPGEVGIYSVAVRVAVFTSFVSFAAAFPLMPAVARLHAAGERGELQRLLTRATRSVVWASLPIAVMLLVLARPLLGLFGAGFEAGTDALRILIVGEFLKLLAGFSGIALLMTGNEGGMPRALVVGVLINASLSVALIPLWGVAGAAVATSVSAVVSTFLMAYYAWSRAGVVAAIVWPRQVKP
jgi:O-antigen/teichoic acid export membrane protein